MASVANVREFENSRGRVVRGGIVGEGYGAREVVLGQLARNGESAGEEGNAFASGGWGLGGLGVSDLATGMDQSTSTINEQRRMSRENELCAKRGEGAGKKGEGGGVHPISSSSRSGLFLSSFLG